MCRVGCAATISAQEQLISSAQTLLDEVYSLCDPRIQIGKRLQRFSRRGDGAP
jgi:hypothetical protein